VVVRHRILHAALGCFTANGYDATTIEHVRAAAGVSVGAVYHHFADKAELAAAVYVDGLRAYHDGFVAALERTADAKGGLRAAVVHHVDWCVEHPDLARFLFAERRVVETGAGAEALGEENRRFLGAVARWYRPHVQYGVLRDLPLDVGAALLFGPAQDWVRLWLAGRTVTPPAKAKRLLADAAWRTAAVEP
jgi:AcrR family transcriptional regulator